MGRKVGLWSPATGGPMVPCYWWDKVPKCLNLWYNNRQTEKKREDSCAFKNPREPRIFYRWKLPDGSMWRTWPVKPLRNTTMGKFGRPCLSITRSSLARLGIPLISSPRKCMISMTRGTATSPCVQKGQHQWSAPLWKTNFLRQRFKSPSSSTISAPCFAMSVPRLVVCGNSTRLGLSALALKILPPMWKPSPWPTNSLGTWASRM